MAASTTSADTSQKSVPSWTRPGRARSWSSVRSAARPATRFGRLATREHDPLLIAGLAALLSLPLFLPFALWQGWHFDFSGVAVDGGLALAWYGAGTLALGSALWYGGVARAEGSVAAGFLGLMPVSALVLSYLLLGEAFRWLHLAGFGVVFLGVLLMSSEHAHHAKGR